MMSWFYDFLAWREKRIKEKQFVVFLSFLVGIFTAIMAYILKQSAHAIEHFLTANFSESEANYYYLVYPIVGIFITSMFVRYVVKDNISHGVTRILYAISQNQARIRRHNTWTSVLASSITIGFGGSVGAEAPIVLTGSAIGSNLGKLFRMNQKTMMLLVGCGASAAIAGIFKAPIAGMVFTIEVLMLDLNSVSIVPLLVSSVTAASLSYFLMGSQAMFYFQMASAFDMKNILYVIALGIACGFVSLYFIRGMSHLEDLYGKVKRPFIKLLIGGFSLSVLIFFFPPLYGEGYSSVIGLINNNSDAILSGSMFYEYKDTIWFLWLYIIGIILFKIFATAGTNGGGGCGGTFAPSLFVGCFSGFLFASVVNYLGLTSLSCGNFALLGMAGVMSGVMYAPLTGIFLIAELTGGYQLFMPLMITSLVSYAVIRVFESHSIYAMRLAKKGELITHHKDKTVLTLLNINNVVEKDLKPILRNSTLRDVVKVVSQSRRNVFPVVDENGTFYGVLLLDNIRNIMFRPALYDKFTVSDLMTQPAALVSDSDSMENVMTLFERTQAWNLPVVDANNKYVGFVSKSKIFNAYRQVLVDFSDE